MEQQRQTNTWLYHAMLLLNDAESITDSAETPIAVHQAALEEGAAALLELALSSLVSEFIRPTRQIVEWRQTLLGERANNAEINRLYQALLMPDGSLKQLEQRLSGLLNGEQKGGQTSSPAMIASDMKQDPMTALLSQLKVLVDELRESGLEW